MVEKRHNVIDHIAMGPHSLPGVRPIEKQEPGRFPQLDKEVLNQEPDSNKYVYRHSVFYIHLCLKLFDIWII